MSFSLPLSYQIKVRWSDLDPNFHLKHSCYYDLATECRIEMLAQHGLTLAIMEENHFAPVIIREECNFYREIKYNDLVYIQFEILEVSDDSSRWKILHRFVDNNGKKKADLTVDTAWFDTQKRRLVKPLPKVAMDVYHAIIQGNNPV